MSTRDPDPAPENGLPETGPLFYDRRDELLVRMVNDLYHSGHAPGYTRNLFYPYFHPLGIKELSESKGLRIAWSLLHLLNSLERGDEERRLQALRGLRAEIIDTRTGPMPLNSARVLLQLMKELIRARGYPARQLELAHDFRRTASGKPGLIRRQLRRYYLLEMPEAWNQVTFDDHVHDANTKGRKTPTHLIMDAWIKGIRRLRVVYYQYLEARFVAELFEAADIMGIDIRIGIEFSALFRGRYISLIWVSRGFMDVQSFLCFLTEPHVAAFMNKGRAVVRYRESYVLKILEAFNRNHLQRFVRETGIDLPELDPNDFLSFVSPGQASILHLGEYIQHCCIRRVLEDDDRDKVREETSPDRAALLENVTTALVIREYLSREHYPEIPCPWMPCHEADVPERLVLSIEELLDEISGLYYNFKLTLNLSGLKPWDVLELLYRSNGAISRLELVNLKDFAGSDLNHLPDIAALQQAINDGSLVRLKQLVLRLIESARRQQYPDGEDRSARLTAILHDLAGLKDMYAAKPLKARMGSDSTGRSMLAFGMGLGVVDTLPEHARREIRHQKSTRSLLPVYLKVTPTITIETPDRPRRRMCGLRSLLGRLPGLEYLGARRYRKWKVSASARAVAPEQGNVVTLGGGREHMKQEMALSLRIPPPKAKSPTPLRSRHTLNTGFRNAGKVLVGFVPAFLTFFLTKDWWVLAWFGAFIWFGITGVRNIIQAVLGGGGIVRSPLLRWNDYVSWERITDSLLFTGFSVPLLDYLVKTVLLDHGMGVTVATGPMTLYAVMAVANGCYLAGHNAFRGFPRAAIFGNLFRSILSIPIAIGFSAVSGGILSAAGVTGGAQILQKWAAVISKAASDLVAALIEGPADRFQNMALRNRDYGHTVDALFDAYARLELLFPDKQSFSLFDTPEDLIKSPSAEVRDLTTVVMILCLDLLYFWMYQPRARTAFRQMMAGFTDEERRIIINAHRILRQEQFISRSLVDGILGPHFAKPLSFYLVRYPEYLRDLEKTVR